MVAATLSLASTLVVFFFYEMLFKIIYGTSYVFKNQARSNPYAKMQLRTHRKINKNEN